MHADTIDGEFNTKAKNRGPLDFLKKNGIKKITPNMIAYAAVQVAPSVKVV